MNKNNLVILTSFNNSLLKYRTEASPIKKADFPTSDHYKQWNVIAERILHAGYSLRIATREGKEASKSQIYQFDIAFDILVNTYFQTQSIILGDLETLKKEILSLVINIKKDKEVPEEGKIPEIKGLRAFKKDLEILLADRLVGKKYRTLEESLKLKEERAARRKAKREAAKAAKKAAAEAAQNSEVIETFKGEVIDVKIPALPLKE
jgi:hypothetical protein